MLESEAQPTLRVRKQPMRDTIMRSFSLQLVKSALLSLPRTILQPCNLVDD